jgi:hypothetical protein
LSKKVVPAYSFTMEGSYDRKDARGFIQMLGLLSKKKEVVK